MAEPWTPELKAKAIQMYQESEPTPENTAEIIKEIADSLEQSPNGVRMILMQANVYVKKTATTDSTKGSAKTSGSEGSKRVSKESQISALKQAILNKGGSVDDDILSKLTGKAAAYFVTILTTK